MVVAGIRDDDLSPCDRQPFEDGLLVANPDARSLSLTRPIGRQTKVVGFAGCVQERSSGRYAVQH